MVSKIIKTEAEQIDNIPPNKVLQPFAYQTWKIIGKTLEASEDKNLGAKSKPLQEFVFRFSKNIAGLFGIFMFIALILCAVFIPLTTQDPRLIQPSSRFIKPFVDGHIFGTDSLGRDVWANLWHGLRFSLFLSFTVALVDLVVGVTLGLIMGYSDKIDYALQFMIKILSNIPVLIILILAVLIFKPSFWVLAISMSVTGWISMANQIRAQVKRAKNFQWVVASRVLGTPNYKILFNFIPLLVPMVITQLVMTIPGAILGETALAFIGLSLPNVPTLGNMIYEGQDFITIFPRYTLLPSSILIVLVTSIQLIGNSSQDALRRQR